MILCKARFLHLICLVASLNAASQGKYQSLMWKITGNDLEKPSYLYGTMHISGKMVFHLGDPFYEAIEKVDVVALELEPEAWLKAIFEDKSSRWSEQTDGGWTTEKGFGYDYEDLPILRGQYMVEMAIQEKVRQAVMFDPAILNYLLFRYGDFGYEADFEEDTWLDMYIYQTGKKLGKETLGLETYDQSDYFIKRAREAERNSEDVKEYDDKDIEELLELRTQFEPAYRRQDLDLIDSLNTRTTSEAFTKYILLERNKIFIANIDSVLRSGKSILAGMGCAHLPGKQGIIELLREKGYRVEAYNKGERNAKRRAKLDKVIYKRDYVPFITNDKKVKVVTPSAVNYLGAEKNIAAWISLDIPNGASFLIQRVKSYAGLSHRDPEEILMSIDSILYEAIAGDIISQRKIEVNGFQGIDVINRSRRGDYQRRRIVVLPEEILILKLTATGDKVKNGYGNEFFNSLVLQIPEEPGLQTWFSADKLVSCSMPGYLVHYETGIGKSSISDLEVTSADYSNHEFYMVQRHTIEDPEFLDEDEFELGRLVHAFCEDNQLKESASKKMTHEGLPSLQSSFRNAAGNTVFAKFVLQNLNYFIFSVLTEDSMKATLFFNSVVFKRPVHSNFHSYQDSTMNFRVMLPYEPLNAPVEDDYFDWSSRKENDENEFLGATGNGTYCPPEETDLVFVGYQRYHKFSDGEDSLKFVGDKEKFVMGLDLKLEKRSIVWNTHGCKMNFVLSDSATVRRYMYQLILFNKTLYTIHASYDSILGPGDFVSTFFETFQPTDTIFPYRHFLNRDEAFLDALTSKDSTTKKNAIGIIGEMDFSDGAASRIRGILQSMPDFYSRQDRELIMEKLTASLASDTSSVNLAFISNSFYQYIDSTVYQLELLRTLLRMKTLSAFSLYKKLILDEPPIMSGRNSSAGFALLSDSLKLAAPLIPDLLQLLALDEYEEAIYSLMAEALDSNIIRPSTYKAQVKQITMEAKNELKRLNSKDEAGFTFDTSPLFTYVTLLHPFRTNDDVIAFFEKAYKTKKNKLLLDLMEFDIEHGVQVNDSIFTRIVREEELIISLYKILHKNHLEIKIPPIYLSRESIASLYIKTKFGNGKDKSLDVDSVQIFFQCKKSIRRDQLEVFYCKFKKVKSKQWSGLILAFDDRDSSNLWPRFLESSKTIVLDDDEDELIELDIEYRKLEEINRRRRNFKSGAENFNIDWN